METNKDVAIEHQNVPVEHRGLHDFLYSSPDEHDTTDVTDKQELESNSNQVLSLEAWCALSQNAKVAGVYAVLNDKQQTQYIGYSRNVLLSLNSHVAQNGTAACAFVRVQTFKFPKRQEMEDLREAWLSELDYIPPGNSEESANWASTVGEAAKATMSASERNAYEEKKLKLRKAMADTALVKELEAKDRSTTETRHQIEAAVENDDWSTVIDGQTQETKPEN
ncbi:MAG: GIY-YIG nuclease family protein [Symplocastrum torsivum CPER-KK1]|jgi:predicted GIY-YIG superfamily endonuclease|uniref:GIY-YIG nuclease family protein n=1 Tax=Symplocastrum torsivum CPER-KK1 TaxID=450513 RepID=A0A951UBH3_9CYAN|nr:GIY-YIG nuclease family protein [Symplocastrum torsivum CPER-KK1]